MAGLSDIEWTDATWNPVSGCSMVSPGCTNCYAMRMAARLQAMHHPSYVDSTRKSGGRSVWTGRVTLNRQVLEAPLKWTKPRMVFVNSMSDLFQEGVPTDFISGIWDVMRRANRHVFQILTKRPERMANVLRDRSFAPLSNVWIGTSVESKDYTFRLEVLRDTPASVRFVSFEPLLDSVGDISLERIDWAIVGGESGPGARPIDVVWVDAIKTACDRSGTAFFFKQWGGTNKKATGREYRGRTWDNFPQPAIPA